MISPLQRLASKFCPLENLSSLEKFDTYTQGLWLASATCVPPSRAEAILAAKNLSGPAIFTDSSAGNSLVGIGIRSPNISYFPVSSTKVGTTHALNVFIGELLAIDVALAQLIHFAKIEQPKNPNITLFTDSQVALNAISYPAAYSGQFLTKAIILKTRQLHSLGVLCILQWSPGHSKIPRNVESHELAQKATLPNCVAPILNNPILLLSTIKENAGRKIAAPDSRATFTNAKVGRFNKSFDKALPGKHTKTMYNGRSKKQLQILCQLRTGISRLNSYLAKIQGMDSTQCRCNRGIETVDHFLFRCPRWSFLRPELRTAAAHRWGDLAYALGGWSNERKDVPLDKWSPATSMISATIKFAIATGRLEDRSDENDEVENTEEENKGVDEEDLT